MKLNVKDRSTGGFYSRGGQLARTLRLRCCSCGQARPNVKVNRFEGESGQSALSDWNESYSDRNMKGLLLFNPGGAGPLRLRNMNSMYCTRHCFVERDTYSVPLADVRGVVLLWAAVVENCCPPGGC